MARTAVNFSGLVRWTNGTRTSPILYFGESKWLQGDIYWASKRGIFRIVFLLNDLGLKCWIVRCPRPASLCPARRFFARWQKPYSVTSRTQPDRASRAGERFHISVSEQLPLTTPHSDDDDINGQSCKGVLRMLSPSTFVLTSLGVGLCITGSVNLCIVVNKNSANETNVSVWSYSAASSPFESIMNNNNISMNSWPADGVLGFAITQPACM
ncbi:hypothetical protein TEQG_06029 [Trichophyton equinum CBS 127.97]|uniref:Uncharacterized protein n=1 Tax=Trichophyton equinum (strain ATCC MYA-4606 / CBS 127.97) TaxID=559882 RepID=F2PYS2_TRIEC|nr:hypothetical protein TEQG_06029 [Trichophyton equinum CBS 127.97]